MICINLSHHYLSDFVISTNQNNKDRLKKATVEMKLNGRKDLVGRCNTCLLVRGHRVYTTKQGAGGRLEIEYHHWTTQRHSQDLFKREMGSIATIVNSFNSLTAVGKLSILDVYKGPGYNQ